MGCGLWGSNILRDLGILGVSTVVVDTDPAARERALAAGAGTVLGEVGAGVVVDGWIVATPARMHRQSIAAVADQGLPILCEKPLTTSLHEAREIAANVRSPLHVMDVWRYHPAVERMQRIVADGELGLVHGLRSTRANWTSPRVDVDTIWNLAPHEVSIYRQLFGVLPEPVSAFAECVDGQARSLWSRWGNRQWMVSEVSNRHATRRRELSLHCERGVALFDAGIPHAIEIASGDSDQRLEASERRQIPIDTETALKRQLSDWLGFVAGGSAPRSDLGYAVQVVGLIETLRRLAGLSH